MSNQHSVPHMWSSGSPATSAIISVLLLEVRKDLSLKPTRRFQHAAIGGLLFATAINMTLFNSVLQWEVHLHTGRSQHQT